MSHATRAIGDVSGEPGLTHSGPCLRPRPTTKCHRTGRAALAAVLTLLACAPARAQEPFVPVDFVSQLGGESHAVAVHGSRAYVGIGQRLAILDVSNLPSPNLLGLSDPLADTVMGVVVSGGYAYVANGGGGLQIISVSNPASPLRVGSYDTSGYAYGVAVSGVYAYVADGNAGVQIINVSNPAAPAGAGSYGPSTQAHGVAVSGVYAYVADGNAGLQIINISNPAAPSHEGDINTSGYARGVAVSGAYAYVADENAGLQIIRVSNPTLPVRVGGYRPSGQGGPFAVAVTVSGGYAYVANAYGFLEIINISDPAAPVLAGNYTSFSPRGLVLSGAYVYMADSGAGLQIIDVSNPASPLRVGTYATGGYTQAVAVTSGFAYAADAGGLQIINVSNPAVPFRVGGYNTSGVPWGVAVSGVYTYLADGYAGLQIINVSNPAAPSHEGDIETSGVAYDVAVAGVYAYVAEGSAGLRVINVSNPAAPSNEGSIDTSGVAYDVAVSGVYAYVAGGGAGLQIIDISPPAAPVLVGSYDTIGSSGGIAVDGGYAYVADGFAGLQVIDVSNPTAPVRVGGYNTVGQAACVAVSGGYAYVADLNAGLQIINVSDPAAPIRVGGYDTSGYALGVAVSGGYAYVADELGGLVTLRIGLPDIALCGNSGLRGGSILAAFIDCMGGPAVSMGGSCDVFDLYPDGYVDLRDFAVLSTQAAGASDDFDGDRIPDEYETDDGVFLGPCATGTDPDNSDTDGDGISDGDETLGTVDGLNLPAMGALPTRKDIFIEVDWIDDSFDGPAHSHKPSDETVELVRRAFADSPVPNPYDAPPGVAVHVDYGQGWPFDRGTLIATGLNIVSFPTMFYNFKATNFDDNRNRYFYYAIFAHRFESSNRSGRAEAIVCDDFMVTLQNQAQNVSKVSKTFMHELGHALGLRHGGGDELNQKPNYNSIMNYKYQFDGVDRDDDADGGCDAEGDDVLDYSYGLLATINESHINECLGICGQGFPIDWNGSGGSCQTDIAYNITVGDGGLPSLDVLNDFNDWAAIRFDGISDSTRSAEEIVTCAEVPVGD